MIKVSHIAIAVLLSLPMGVVTAANVAEWQPMEELAVAPNKQKVEITASDGNIKITTETEIDVEIYTILGRFITRKHLSPGVTEISVPNRGIYIVRVGRQAIKIAV